MPQSTEKHFIDVLKEEVDVINRRRELVAAGRLIQDRDDHGFGYSYSIAVTEWASIGVHHVGEDERGQCICRLHSEQEIVGLALSGGGVRSAAFCLGVLQGLDAISPNEKPQVIDAVDYLSTVSGGGYIGVSFTSGVMQSQGRLPFESKLDNQETLETKHIRDNSNYLVPDGFIDVVTGIVAIMRGLLINATIFLAIILAAAALTVALDSTLLNYSVWLALGIISVCVCIQIQLKRRLRPAHGSMLALREITGRVSGYLFIFCALGIFFVVQPHFVDLLSQLLNHQYTNRGLNPPFLAWAILAIAAVALVIFGNKLAAVATARRGDQTWLGSLKHWASRFALYAAAVVVPLLLWFTYLLLCYWGNVPLQAPTLLTWLCGHSILSSVWTIYAIAALILFAIASRIEPNGNSLHGYYRDRLARAFLWKLDKLADNYSKTKWFFIFLCNIKSWRRGINHLRRSINHDGNIDVDQFKLSSLKNKNDSECADDVRFAPYLLMNTSVNLEGSEYLNRRTVCRKRSYRLYCDLQARKCVPRD
jgi:hypothetical protein